MKVDHAVCMCVCMSVLMECLSSQDSRLQVSVTCVLSSAAHSIYTLRISIRCWFSTRCILVWKTVL